MRWYSRGERLGMTLVEALVSMVVFAFIVGVTGAIYLSALRMYKEGFSGLAAHDNAQLALASVLPSLREAMEVTEPSTLTSPTPPYVSSTLEYVLPRRDSAGHYLVDPSHPDGPMFWGTKVKVYLGDEDGAPNSEGTRLWEVRATIPVGSSTPPPYDYSTTKKLAEGITSIEFEHPVRVTTPVSYLLWDHVNVTFVGSATMWNQTVEAEEKAETAIRNHG